MTFEWQADGSFESKSTLTLGGQSVNQSVKITPDKDGRWVRTIKAAEFLEMDKVYEYHLDLWQTGITIPKGRRLRVEVASASFPSFSRNLNTGGHNETETSYVKAEQKVYHGKRYPSHVLLPVVEVKGK